MPYRYSLVTGRFSHVIWGLCLESPPLEISLSFFKECPDTFSLVFTAEGETKKVGLAFETFAEIRAGSRFHRILRHAKRDRTFFGDAAGQTHNPAAKIAR